MKIADLKALLSQFDDNSPVILTVLTPNGCDYDVVLDAVPTSTFRGTDADGKPATVVIVRTKPHRD